MSFIIRNGAMIHGSQPVVSPEDNEELMSLKSARIWDAKFGPQRKLFRAPSYQMIRNRAKERRFSIEVMKPCSLSDFSLEEDFFDDETNSDSSEEIHNENMMKLLNGNKTKEVDVNCNLLPDEKVVLRVFKTDSIKKIPSNGDSKSSTSNKKKQYSSDESISTLGFGSAADNRKRKKTWIEEHCYLMEDITLLRRYKSTIEVSFNKDSERIKQTLIFRTGSESRSFFESILAYQDLEQGHRDEKPELDSPHCTNDTLVTITESEDGMD